MKKQTRPTLEVWSTRLQEELFYSRKVFVVIDALDELSESNRDSFLDQIQGFEPSMNLLVTSRHMANIERRFKHAECVKICASDEDVRRYLEGQMKKERLLVHHIEKVPSLQETIVSRISERAEGM